MTEESRDGGEKSRRSTHEVCGGVAQDERNDGVELSRLVSIDQRVQEVVSDQVEGRGGFGFLREPKMGDAEPVGIVGKRRRGGGFGEGNGVDWSGWGRQHPLAAKERGGFVVGRAAAAGCGA